MYTNGQIIINATSEDLIRDGHSIVESFEEVREKSWYPPTAAGGAALSFAASTSGRGVNIGRWDASTSSCLFVINSSSGLTLTLPSPPINGTWVHYCIQKEANSRVIRSFYNGSPYSTVTGNSTQIPTSVSTYKVANIYLGTGVNYATAEEKRFDEMRISNIARYPNTGFTLQTKPFPPK